jgi:hypothetical protein
LRVRETPGTITVFEGADEAVAVQATTLSETRPEDSDSITNSEMDDQILPQAPASAIDQAAPVIEALGEQALPKARAHEPKPGPATQLVEPALPVVEPVDEIEWAAIVKASGELVGGVERALSGPGADFNSIFDGARLELADDYTFLDPMSGEFTYSDSVVTLGSELPVGSYVIGLSETLRRVVDAVAIGDRARRVRERVALELVSVARKRREILERSGFLSQLDRIAGTKVL